MMLHIHRRKRRWRMRFSVRHRLLELRLRPGLGLLTAIEGALPYQMGGGLYIHREDTT